MKFFAWMWGKIGWFISLIIASVLSITVVNIPDILLKFEILIGLLVSGLFVLLLFYSINFHQDYERIMLSQRVPMDAFLNKLHKKIIFNDVTYTEKQAEIRIFREIYNNMIVSNEIYDRFKVKISSKTDVPHIEEITVKRGDKTIALNKLDSDTVNPIRCFEIDSNDVDLSDPLKKKIEFYVPLHLKAGKTCEFELIYPSKAYKNALEGNEDFVQLQVNRITEVLIFEVILNGEMEKEFRLTACVDTDGTRLTHKIFDASLERMKRTESTLKERPKYYANNVLWKIERPKIGYNYRMYFRLLPKNRRS